MFVAASSRLPILVDGRNSFKKKEHQAQPEQHASPLRSYAWESAAGILNLFPPPISFALINLDDSGVTRVALADRLVPGFGPGVWLLVFAGSRCHPGCPGRHRLDPRRGGLLPAVVGAVYAGQVSACRAQSRCQQVVNASFHGQVRLIFSTRLRACRTS